MTSHQSLKRLKEGNSRFVKDLLDGKLQDNSRRKSLIDKQEPYAIILGCADSRIVPELAFDTGLGELFTIRVAGNIANTSSIASIEYAVAHCGSKL
ncbi:MAG: carbonic anhydrase, partial [Flavobacteriaceae bacterium]